MYTPHLLVNELFAVMSMSSALRIPAPVSPMSSMCLRVVFAILEEKKHS